MRNFGMKARARYESGKKFWRAFCLVARGEHLLCARCRVGQHLSVSSIYVRQYPVLKNRNYEYGLHCLQTIVSIARGKNQLRGVRWQNLHASHLCCLEFCWMLRGVFQSYCFTFFPSCQSIPKWPLSLSTRFAQQRSVGNELDFYLAAQTLQKAKDLSKEQILEEAKRIFAEFVVENAPKEVAFSALVHNELKNRIKSKPTTFIYQNAMMEIGFILQPLLIEYVKTTGATVGDEDAGPISTGDSSIFFRRLSAFTAPERSERTLEAAAR